MGFYLNIDQSLCRTWLRHARISQVNPWKWPDNKSISESGRQHITVSSKWQKAVSTCILGLETFVAYMTQQFAKREIFKKAASCKPRRKGREKRKKNEERKKLKPRTPKDEKTKIIIRKKEEWKRNRNKNIQTTMFVFFTSTIPLDLFWRAGGRGQGIKPHLGSLSASSRSYAAAGVGQHDGLQGNSERVAAVHLLSASLSPYFGKLLHINVLSRVIFFRVIFFFFSFY